MTGATASHHTRWLFLDGIARVKPTSAADVTPSSSTTAWLAISVWVWEKVGVSITVGAPTAEGMQVEMGHHTPTLLERWGNRESGRPRERRSRPRQASDDLDG